ncbi:MAG: type IV pili twitching motility protein PilT, partial [Patescibacteria group bacterium]
MQPIKFYFKEAMKKDASDLHLVGGQIPVLRIDGQLQDIENEPLDNKTLEAQILTLISKEQVQQYHESKELDFGLNIEDVRFRVNLH